MVPSMTSAEVRAFAGLPVRIVCRPRDEEGFKEYVGVLKGAHSIFRLLPLEPAVVLPPTAANGSEAFFTTDEICTIERIASGGG